MPEVIVNGTLCAIPGAEAAIRAFVAAGKATRMSFPNGSDYLDWSLPFREWNAVSCDGVTVGAEYGYCYLRSRDGSTYTVHLRRVYGGPGVSFGVYFHTRDLTALEFSA